jgi:hypothetical protein
MTCSGAAPDEEQVRSLTLLLLDKSNPDPASDLPHSLLAPRQDDRATA